MSSPKHSTRPDSKNEKFEDKTLGESSEIQSDIAKIIGDEGIGSVGSWQSVYSPTTVTMAYKPNKGPSRYKESLKHFIPVRIKTGPGSVMPVDQTGCFAFVLFSWLTPLVWRAFKHGLNISDIYYCSPYESAKVNGARLSAIWERASKEKSPRKVPFRQIVFRFISTRYVVACFAYSLCLAFGFIGPALFMRMLLEYVESPDDDYFQGLFWTFGLFLCETLRIFCFVSLWAVNCRTAIRASAGLTSVIYAKVMKLRATSGKTAGEMTNLFSNDVNKVMLMVYTSPLIIGGPMVMVAAIIYTWWLIGHYAFVSVLVFLVAYVFQYVISKCSIHMRKQAVSATDARVSLMREILTYIKLVKLYAWERPFAAQVTGLRKVERAFLEKCQFLQSINTSTSVLVPVASTILTIVTYTATGHNLHPSEAFTLLMVNFITSHGLRTLPLCIRDIVNGLVALQRIDAFMNLDDKESYATLPARSDLAVYVSKATLSWPVTPDVGEDNKVLIANPKMSSLNDGAEDQTTLVIPLAPQYALLDITFTVPVGHIVGVCGSIGAGKSSLLYALLGQMELIKGQVSLKSSCAYVTQQSWILNSTLKENILFGQPFNSKRYYEAVYCCSLTEDIAALPHGDQTEIGEGGMTLSGGQKQRLSLARALYANKDLYLLDDPLSAVDGLMARHIFQHCIKGALRGKSIILVTHHLPFLSECDKIIFMRNGQIIETGSHKMLLEQGSEYAHFISIVDDENLLDISLSGSRELLETSDVEMVDLNLSRSPSQPKSLASQGTSCSGSVDDGLAATNAVTFEEISSGEISSETYNAYIRSAGGYIVSSLMVVWFILHGGIIAFSNWWLSYWIKLGSGEILIDENTGRKLPTSIILNPYLETYEMIYGLSIVAVLFSSLILAFLFIKTTFRASSHFHDSLLHRVLRCPMRFFETIPSGRILNIFTRDLDEVDTQLPGLLDSFLQHLTSVVFSLLLVAYVFAWFYVAIGCLAFLFYLLHRMFRVAVRDLKRIENVSRAPMYSHISASVYGLSTIQAFQRQEEFMERFSNLVDKHSAPLYLYYSSLRWLAARMDFLCLVITLLVSLLAVFLKYEVGASLAGLAIVLSMQLSGTFQYLVRVGCDVESRFTSVERIHAYTENLETEADSIVEENRPPADWPTRGRISFREVTMKYRPGLPAALRGVTFDISPQEKIGIVGKTGAGKSSLGVALFRLVELVSGTIHIDGIDISQIGLEDLRSRLSIIPQDPILFCGTIRQNLDPLSSFEDSELWEALEKTHMKDKISGLPGGLDSLMKDKGENFSLGERQLFCIARCLLRRSKVVVLDEATASMDNETDQLIQETVQELFLNCTVLIIAHRINSVLNCDRIMVVESGKVVEFDHPKDLLANPKSRFFQMSNLN